MAESKKLNIKLAKTLINKILVYPDKTIDIYFRFSRGGAGNEKNCRVLSIVGRR